MDWVKNILPTIGGLLGGPLGSAAVNAVADAIGLSDKTKESVEKALSSGNLTTEQMAVLQAADLQLKTRMAELGIEVEKLAAQDRDSARKMQIATGSWVPDVIAMMFIGTYLLIIALLLTGHMKLWSENPTLTMLLGGLTAGVAGILGFYFGASHTKSLKEK